MNGSKNKMASQIVKLFPKTCNVYCEPFCGSASVYMNSKIEANRVFLTDKSPIIVGMLNSMKEASDLQLEQWSIQCQDYIESNTKENYVDVRNNPLPTNSFGYFCANVLQTMSFMGFFNWVYTADGTLSNSRNVLYTWLDPTWDNVSANLVDNDISVSKIIVSKVNSIKKVYREKLKNAEIRIASWEENKELFKDSNNVIFLDPPYVEGYVDYHGGDFNDVQREELIKTCNAANAKLFYADYDHELLPTFDKFTLRENGRITGLPGFSQKAKRHEVIFANYSMITTLF